MTDLLKTSFRPSPRSLYPNYTGGPVVITRDGRWIATTLGDESDSVLISRVRDGLGVARIKGDGSSITAMTISYHTSPPTIITAHQSLSIRYYPLPPFCKHRSQEDDDNDEEDDEEDFIPTDNGQTKLGKPKFPYLSYNRQLTKNQTHSAPILVLSLSPTIPSSSTSGPSSSKAIFDSAAEEQEKTLLATGSSDGVVKVWDVIGGFVTHVYKGHGGGVSALSWRFLSPQGEIREDEEEQTGGYMNAPSSSSRGISEGGKVMQLITGSVDTRIRIFDLLSRDPASKPIHVLEGHVSVVRGIDVDLTSEQGERGRWMITAGRDRVVFLWDFASPVQGGKKISNGGKKSHGNIVGGAPRVVQTTMTNELIESVGFVSLPSSSVLRGSEEGRRAALVAFTGGEKGVVRVWDVQRGAELGRMDGPGGLGEDEDEEDEDEVEERGIREVLYNRSTGSLVSIHHDQNILLTSLETKKITRQIIGFNDEIIDCAYLGPNDSTIALATNSSLIRIYDAKTLDARLVPGHTDVVLCLDVSADGNWLISGSKDNTVRVWGKTSIQGDWKCLAIAEGHAESIGAVAVSRKEMAGRGRFLFSASQDKTVKMWDLSMISTNPEEYPKSPIKLKSLTTMKIHEKDINSLDVAPNDGYLVSGSQDKSIKVFSVDFTEGKQKPGQDGTGYSGASGAIRLLGTCTGHRRGVWAVKFSPTDKVIASCGGDRVARLWSLDDFTCVKTLEGHTNSVLRVDFMSKGQQLVTTASDGLVKIWNLRDEECIKTLDGHVDKVWTLAISKDEKTILSGGADSVLNMWEDCTAEVAAEAIQKREGEVALEQDYSSYLALKDYRRAIQLALAMAQPRRLLNLFEKVSNNRPRLADEAPSTGQLADMQSMTGLAAVDEVLRTLSAKDLVRLLKYVRDWNSRANTSGTAQRVLGAILRGRKGEDLRECFEKARRSMVKATTEDDEDDEPEAPAQEDQKKRKPTRAVEELLSLQDWLDGIVPYTERHLQRLDRALVDTFMLDYVLGEMDGGILDGIEEIEEEGETGRDAMEGLVDMLVDELDGDDSESLPSIPEMEME